MAIKVFIKLLEIQYRRRIISLSPRYFYLGAAFNQVKRSDVNKETQEWSNHESGDLVNPVYKGLDPYKKFPEEESCLYPTIRQLNVSTTDKVHNFSVPCDTVIRFIKLGAINKNIAVQYCHYLVELALNSQEKSELEFYSRRCLALTQYLLKQPKDLTSQTQIELICGVASIDDTCCSSMCQQVLDQQELLNKFSTISLSKLLISCYKFESWNLASLLFNKRSQDKLNGRLVDPLVEGLTKSSIRYKESTAEKEKSKIKRESLNHLMEFIRESHEERLPFITKHPEELIKALEVLGVKVSKNPVIKMSGRCTNCDKHIPLYEANSLGALHQSITNMLYKKEESANDQYVYIAPDDVKRFENFLNYMYKFDKKPIDCVIDGLNIAYKNSAGYIFTKRTVSDETGSFLRTVRRHDPSCLSRVLINAILRGNMLEKFRKILVIGKKHMNKWPDLADFFEKNRIFFYASSDSSQDDLLQLYAATLNTKTVIVTNDFLRDHLALLESIEDRRRLERWIDTHQAWIGNKTLKPTWPTPYEKVPSLQADSGHFHIPVIDYNKLDSIALHEPPPHLNSSMTKWICCKAD